MELPSRPYQLAERIHVRPKRVEVTAWQAHVISHPFGLHSLRAGIGRGDKALRRWNYEGWDTLGPPLLTEESRQLLTAAIRQLTTSGDSCRVPELEQLATSEPPRREDVECYSCPTLLAQSCMETVGDVSRGYASYLDKALAELEDAIPVDRRRYSVALRSPYQLRNDPAPVASVGELRNTPGIGLRINRPDGIRLELYDQADGFHWRTTYRNPIRDVRDLRRHLFDHLHPLPDGPLSGKILVPRLWWERQRT